MLLSSLHVPNALPVGGTMFRNAVVNAGMNVNQRQTSSNMTSMATTSFSSGPTPSAFFVADRWIAYRTGFAAGGQMALMGLSNTDLPFVSAGLTSYARIGRATGDVGTSNLNLAQNIESLSSIPMAAKVVSLSFYARAGANFSGASGTAIAALGLGVSTDSNVVVGLGSSSSTMTNAFQPSTSWQRLSWSLTIPATATQVCPQISYSPTGTAGAGDYLDVTGVQLEISNSATQYELRPYAIELQLCSRFYTQYNFSNESFGLYVCEYSNASKATSVFNLAVPLRTKASIGIINAGNWTISGSSAITGFSASPYAQAVQPYQVQSITVEFSLNWPGAAINPGTWWAAGATGIYFNSEL